MISINQPLVERWATEDEEWQCRWDAMTAAEQRAYAENQRKQMQERLMRMMIPVAEGDKIIDKRIAARAAERKARVYLTHSQSKGW